MFTISRLFILFLKFLCGVILLQAVWYLLRWPVIAWDTDVWFHLDYGRYILEHRTIPQSTYFSFIDPPLPLIDYAWLFQVVVYALHSVWGYEGLIAWRTVVFIALTGLLWRFVFQDASTPRRAMWAMFLWVCCCLVLVSRGVFVRPHMVSYVMLAAFLLILEHGRRSRLLLPLLAVVWCNMHSMAFPLLGLISIAYGAEWVVNRGRRKDRLLGLSLGLSVLAMLATPHDLLRLLTRIPSSDLMLDYVRELKPVSWELLSSLQFRDLIPDHQTILNVWFFLSVTAVAVLLTRRRIRLSHLLLWGGGVGLLPSGWRFQHELMILTLPLLRAFAFSGELAPSPSPPRPLSLVLIGALALIPMACLNETFVPRSAYPVSRQQLPVGVVAFLKTVDAGGRLMHHPNTGGYLRWTLWPRYQIFMDMESPGLPDRYYYWVTRAFEDADLLKTFLATHDPSFISVPIARKRFPELIASYPDYVLVFFDDEEALYVNRRHHPQVAEAHALHGVNPFALAEKSVEELKKHVADELAFRYLAKLLTVDPGCEITNHLAAIAYEQDGAYDKMLPHAEAIIESYPESSTGYELKARALHKLGALDEALSAYQLAWERSDKAARVGLGRTIGLLYLAHQQHAEAYRWLRASLDLFSSETDQDDARALIDAARGAGKLREAKRFSTLLIE
ncbi:MAG: hypothetical protein HY595_05715 [Candidatus Omnitrophica bacterium]|nr:hypothetical protein [Candidatus Omnitrophota bacterium]